MNGNQDEKIFDIDINQFNKKMREFLYSQLKDIYEISEEELNQFYIHIGIKESDSDTGMRPEIEGPVFYMSFDNPDEEHLVVNVSEQEWNEAFLEHIKARWPYCCNEDNTFLQEGSKVLTCGNAQYEKLPFNNMVGNYKVLWAVCDKSGGCSVVHRLVMQVVLYILVNGFRDINQISAIGYSKNVTDVLERLIKNEKFRFIDLYVEKLFQKYNLPNKEECEQLALLSHEKRECQGEILLVDPVKFDEKSCKEGEILFYNKERNQVFSNADYTRKMLEVCRGNNYLLVSSAAEHNVIGYIQRESMDPDDSGIVIEYKGVANWSVYFEREEILCHKRGSYYISKKEYKKNICDILEKIKGDMLWINKGIEVSDPDAYKKMNAFDSAAYTDIINQLESVDHGALLVIAHDAEDEVKRLCDTYGRGTRIAKVSMIGETKTKNMLTGLASVDGAVFMDLEGQCHAFGVILDGEAKTRGKSDQGSRHNSANNYIAGENRIAVIVSEDKDKGTEILYGKNVEVI